MLHEYFTQKLFTRKNGEHWIRISDGRMFNFGLNMLHIADHKFDICEQKNNWWFWFGSFPMKICLWENFFYGIETTCGHHRKTEFQVEFPSLSSEHFLMTEEVRCNLWLSSPDIFCFCATSVHFSSLCFCQLDSIHLITIHLRKISPTPNSKLYLEILRENEVDSFCWYSSSDCGGAENKSRKSILREKLHPHIDWRQFIFQCVEMNSILTPTSKQNRCEPSGEDWRLKSSIFEYKSCLSLFVRH